MEFKIDPKKRIKIKVDKMIELKKQFNYQFLSDFLKVLCNDSGLKSTSRRYSRIARCTVYYFQITDKQKYMLGKIKYGF